MSPADETRADEAPPPDEPTPRLAELRAAFDAGDYAQVRSLAALLERDNPALADTARAWVDRTRPEPLVLWLFGLSAVVLLCATFFAYGAH